MKKIDEGLDTAFLKYADKQSKNNENLSTTTTDEDDFRVVGDFNDYYIPPNARVNSYNIAKKAKNDNRFTRKNSRVREYRRISTFPEVASAIDEIVNEVVSHDSENVITPKLDFKSSSKISDNIKKKMVEEFAEVMNIVDFENEGPDLFLDWYIDGDLVGELIYDNSKPKDGVKGIILKDPTSVIELRDNVTKDKFYKSTTNYKHLYDVRFNESDSFKEEQIARSTSGLINRTDKYEIGYLDYALKTVNSMENIEDSLVIYRYLRSSERRIWNVDVGNQAKTKAQNYLDNVRNAVKYDKYFDRETGELKGKTKMESILNDYIFPTKNGKAGTTVDTIQGDTSFISDLNDHELFLKKLYIALKIPVNRLDESSTLDFSGEDIEKNELKFIKFTRKLQKKFSMFFLEILKRHMIVKNIIKEDDWKEHYKDLVLVWNTDNDVLSRAKTQQLVQKAEAYDNLEESGIIGKFLSIETVMKNVFNMTEDEFKEEQKKIDKEREDGLYDDNEEE